MCFLLQLVLQKDDALKMGEKVVKSHMNCERHKKASKKCTRPESLTLFYSWSNSRPSSNKSSNTIVMPTDAACAEIIWFLNVAQKNFSANSCDGI